MGSRSKSSDNTVIEQPCKNSDILRKKRSPQRARITPCKARMNAAENIPLAVTANRWAARKRVTLGGAMAAGRTRGARKLESNRKPAIKMQMAAILARNSFRFLIGKLESTKTSNKSGKNKSHSKTVMMPIATNEYST